MCTTPAAVADSKHMAAHAQSSLHLSVTTNHRRLRMSLRSAHQGTAPTEALRMRIRLAPGFRSTAPLGFRVVTQRGVSMRTQRLGALARRTAFTVFVRTGGNAALGAESVVRCVPVNGSWMRGAHGVIFEKQMTGFALNASDVLVHVSGKVRRRTWTCAVTQQRMTHPA